MSTTSHLRESLNNQLAQCKIVDLFLAHFEAKLPEGLGSLTYSDLNPTDYPPGFCVSLVNRSPEDRDRALTVLGEVFGTHGWEAKLRGDYTSNVYYDWSKSIPVGNHKVRIAISGARKLEEIAVRPVAPTEFPLALTDRVEEEA